MLFYTDTCDCGLSGVLDNGVTTWLYAKLYSGQRIVSVQLLPAYTPTGINTFKFEVVIIIIIINRHLKTHK